MKKRAFCLTPVILVIFALAFSPCIANADHVIKGKKHTDAFSMAGRSQPAKDEDTTTWLAKDKMRQDVGEVTTLIRMDKNKMYMINHSDKTYSEMDLPFNLEEILPADAKQMMDAMDISSSITDTGETQTINNWMCKKYLVEISVSMMGMGMPIKMDLWTSKDLGVDLNEFKQLYTKTLAMNPKKRVAAVEHELNIVNVIALQDSEPAEDPRSVVLSKDDRLLQAVAMGHDVVKYKDKSMIEAKVFLGLHEAASAVHMGEVMRNVLGEESVQEALLAHDEITEENINDHVEAVVKLAEITIAGHGKDEFPYKQATYKERGGMKINAEMGLYRLSLGHSHHLYLDNYRPVEKVVEGSVDEVPEVSG